MQEKDSATNTFLRDNERFAEIFNIGLFGGEKILNPKKLKEVDRTSGVMLTDNKDKIDAVTKYRDVVKESEIGISRIITAVENQSEIHYAMPVRVLLLDALDYESQRGIIQKKHKEEKDLRNAEFLSGFSKEDKLKPMLNLVIYYGKEPWDGPRSLHDLLDFTDIPQKIKECIPDYKLHILEVRKMEQIEEFQTDVGIVFGFLQKSSNEEDLRTFVKQHQEEYAHANKEVFDVVKVLTNDNRLDRIKEKIGDGGGNVIEAFDQMEERGRKEGECKKLISLIQKKVAKNMDTATIADMLEEDIKVVESIYEIIKAHPEYTTDEIYKVYEAKLETT